MSAYSTLYVSRSKARSLLMERIHQLTDDQLENFVNELTEPRLYRVSLSGETEGQDDEQLARAMSY
mgnify:CR=1 FL=1